MQKFNLKGHGFLRKTKAFGLASGIVLGATLLIGANTVSADETNSGQPATTMQSGTDTSNLDFSNRQEVDKIENNQTASNNPDSDGYYNSQIKSVEIVKPQSNSMESRIRVEFKDGYKIPDRGEVRLQLSGSANISSVELKSPDRVVLGKVSMTPPSTPVEKDLQKTTSLAEYRKLLETNQAEKLGGPTNILLQFNENFAKLDQNRYAEFVIKSTAEDVNPNSPLYYTKNDLSSNDEFFTEKNGYSPFKSVDTYVALPSVKDKKIKAVDNTLRVFTKKLKPIREGAQAFTLMNGSTNLPVNISGLTEIRFMGPGVVVDSDIFTHDIIRQGGATKPLIESGTRVSLSTKESGALSFDKTFQSGQILDLPIITKRKTEGATNLKPRFSDSDTYVTSDKVDAVYKEENLKVKVIKSSNNEFTFETVGDVNSTEGLETGLSVRLLQNFLGLRVSDNFLNAVGKDKIANFMKDSAATSLTLDESLGLNFTIRRNGADKVIKTNSFVLTKPASGVAYGETTTGTVKVKYVDEAGNEIPNHPTETIAENQPWSNTVTITPKKIDGYAFVKASGPLQTLVGSGEQVITLTYRKLEPVDPNAGKPIVDTIIKEYKPNPKLDPGTQNIVDPGKPRKTQGDKVVDPGKPQVIEVGTKPKVVEEEIPFEKKTRENPNLPEGTSKVVQEGKNGKKKTTTTYTLDPKTGKVTPNTPTVETTPPVDQITEIGKGKDKDGDLVVNYIPDPESPQGKETIVDEGSKPKLDVTGKVKDPGKPKVIKVGTKPKVVEEEIPFEKKIRENPNLPEGTSKVVQEGKNGKKKTTTTYTLDPKTGKVTPNTPTVETTPPVDQITEIGKGKDKDGDLVVNYIPDPESPQGKETIVDEGSKPKLDVTGKVKDPGKPKVIKVGTKPKVVEEEIPFEKKIRENPNLPEGTSKVVQEGKNGKKKTTTTYTLDPKTGKVTPNTPTVETTPPVDQITEIGKGKDKDGDLVVNYIPDPESPQGNETIVDEGSKPKLDITGKVKDPGKPKVIKVGTKPKVVEEEIPFEKKTRENPNLPEGTSKVVQEGKNGKKKTTTTYTLDPKTGKVTPNTPTVETTPPVDQITEIGKGKDKDGDLVVNYIPDPESPQGNETIVDEGSKPKLDITGKVKDPGKPKVIKVGTKPKVVEEEIPFKETVVENPSKPEGSRTVLKEGKVGKKTTTTTYTLDPKTGKVTPNTTTSTVPPEDRLIEVGTGKNVNGDIVTEYVPDLELEPGQTKVVQNGTPEVKDVTGKVVTPGTPTIIHIGIKPKVVEENVPFEREYKDNPKLPEGVENVIQKGVNGKKVTTTTYTVDTKTGKVTSTDKVDETPVVNEIVERGTGKNITGEIVVNYVPDPELEPGKTKVVQEGTPEVKDVTGKVVTPGKPTIIHVGTKPKVVEEETPFKEETRENKDLPKGQTKVVQEGKVGKKTTTTTYEVDPKTGTVTPTEKVEETPAVNKITEIGTKEEAKPTPTPTSQTPAKPQVQELKKQLPSTGSATSVALTLAGLSVMGLAATMVLKKKEQ